MPLRDYRGYLWDITIACEHIQRFAAEKQLEDYLNNTLLRSAIERQLIILGEALTQANKHFPHTSEDIPNIRSIIGLRNRLVHAYLHIDDRVVWGIVVDDVPRLLMSAKQLLATYDG